MARPERNTVDYFPHMCGNGKKMFFIETKYGNDGYATWYKILEKLATTDYHFLNLNKEEEILFLSATCKISESKLLEIINDLSKIGAFNKIAWDKKILWSDLFIESIQDAYIRRNNKCITFDSLCIHLLSLGIQLIGYCTKNDNSNTQSKVDYNKVKESIEDRKLKFSESLKPFLITYGKDMLNDFYSYWTEPNKSGTKFKKELQVTWDTERRLKTWANNSFGNKNIKQPFDKPKGGRVLED